MNSAGDHIYPGRDLEVMSVAVNYHQWIYDEFHPYIRGCVAEIGSGIGDYSAHLLHEVKELHLIEPAENLYQELKTRFSKMEHVKTYPSTLSAAMSDGLGSLNTIIYINVLEHIEDDAAEVELMYRCLTQGGHALIFVPALPALYSRHDREIGHHRRYRRSDLLKLAEEAGFDIVTVKYFDLLGIIPWYVNFKLLGRGLGVGSIDLYDRFVVPIMRPLEKKFPPPVGKNLLVILKKES